MSENKFGRRVVVTGGGLISALGNDWASALKSLKACKNFTQYMPEWEEKYPLMNTKLASPINFKIDSKTKFIANGFNFCVFYSAKRIYNVRKSGDTRCKSSSYISVNQGHFRSFVIIFVVHIMN